MAKANGTCSHVVAALIQDIDEEKVARGLLALARMGRTRLTRVIRIQSIKPDDRRLVVKLHRLLRAPRNDRPTLELIDRWFTAYPALLTTTKRQSTYKLMTWVDSAAEAYVRL